MGLTSGRSQQRYSQHLGHDDVGKGLKQGVLLKTIIRFNAQDRQQAFATIEGLPSDLMIRVRSRTQKEKSVTSILCLCSVSDIECQNCEALCF